MSKTENMMRTVLLVISFVAFFFADIKHLLAEEFSREDLYSFEKGYDWNIENRDLKNYRNGRYWELSDDMRNMRNGQWYKIQDDDLKNFYLGNEYKIKDENLRRFYRDTDGRGFDVPDQGEESDRP